MSYDAFTPAAARPAGPGPITSASLVDEPASAWLRRDAATPNMPDAIKQIQGSARLWGLLPCVDHASARKKRSSHSRRGSNNMEVDVSEFSTGAGGAAASSAATHAAASSSAFLDPRLHASELVELFGRSGTGKTEMLYQIVIHTLLPKVRAAQRVSKRASL